MLVLISCLLAVVAIYFVWRIYRDHHEARERKLRERVAFMLWEAAEESHGPVPGNDGWFDCRPGVTYACVDGNATPD